MHPEDHHRTLPKHHDHQHHPPHPKGRALCAVSVPHSDRHRQQHSTPMPMRPKRMEQGHSTMLRPSIALEVAPTSRPTELLACMHRAGVSFGCTRFYLHHEFRALRKAHGIGMQDMLKYNVKKDWCRALAVVSRATWSPKLIGIAC